MTGRCSLILGKNETWESAANLARELQGQEDAVLVMVGLLTRGKIITKDASRNICEDERCRRFQCPHCLPSWLR